jgi:bifunctional non-homologous end joining protein LigD
MLIRRNTKAFKSINEIVSVCQTRADRQELVRLYITKAGQSVADMISIGGSQSEAAFFYDLNYHAIANNLKSSTHQLYQSDEIPGLYFFHSTLSKDWDETPFEFDVKVKELFATLPELPATRQKGKHADFVLPDHTAKPTGKQPDKPKVVEKKATMFIDRGPKQPDYKLKKSIEFTDLERVVFRNPQISKKDVLHFYNKISEYLLPYLKDRPHLVRMQSDMKMSSAFRNLEVLPKLSSDGDPDWIQSVEDSNGETMFLANDKEHLLYYVQSGCVEFVPCHSRKNALASPDYMIIGVDPGSDFISAVNVVLMAKGILDGLKLPSFIKTDARSGFHIYIPLDSKSEYDSCSEAAELICRLIRLKDPSHVTLKGDIDQSYGKVMLDYSLNEEGVGVICPYSLASGGPATIATPLLWEEVTEELHIEDYNYDMIFNRLKKVGDPFEELYSKKINADTILERLQEHYSFLV